MNSLFVQPPIVEARDYLSEEEARKIASNRLTSAPSYWADEVTQTLLRDHPDARLLLDEAAAAALTPEETV